MKIKTLALSTLYTTILTASVPVMAHNSILVDAKQAKQQTQQTTINLSLANLRSPHILKISTPTTATQLNGEIQLNGRFIGNLRNNSTQINLSPSLTQGRHTLKISGNYIPSSSSVMIELTGLNTQVSQQTGGSGYINQIIIIDVR